MLATPDKSTGISPAGAKLRLDFMRSPSLCVVMQEDSMDDEAQALADRLCAVAGMIMEDQQMLALTKPRSDVERRKQHTALQTAAQDIAALVTAAEVLVRQG